DPKIGNGSAVTPEPEERYIESNGDMLRYRLPLIQYAVFSAPYADAQGNIYFKNAATITENLDAARAAKKNGGIVMVVVADIIEKKDDEISVSADMVDFIVVNPHNEQTGSVPQRHYWK